MQNAAKENKMGVMPIGKLLVNMSLPMMLSMLVQALYNIVDSVFVAQIAEDALTALSMAFPLQNLMIAVSTGIGVGVNALLSRALGAKDKRGVAHSAVGGILLVAGCGVVFTLMGLVVPGAFFRAQTNIESIVTYGVDYTTIVLCGCFGLFTQILCERLLQSTGRSVLAMISQGTGAIINIIMDPILIFGLFGFPAMGVKGAALATILGQWIAAVLGVYMNLRFNPEVSGAINDLKPHGATIMRILAIGVPSVVMMSIGSVMTFSMNLILIAFSSTAVAVFGVYFKLQSFIFMPIFGLNNGSVPIMAFNYGARRPDRMMQTVKYAIITAMSIMLLGTVIFQIMPDKLLRLFDASDDMLSMGVIALRIISVHFPIAGACIVMGSIFQALGYSVYSMVVSIIRQLVVLIPTAFLLGKLTGNVDMVWLAFIVAEASSLLVSAFFFRRIYGNVIKPMFDEQKK